MESKEPVESLEDIVNSYLKANEVRYRRTVAKKGEEDASGN